MNSKGTSNTLVFDSGTFALESVKRALYRFAEQCSFDIRSYDGEIRVSVYAKDILSDGLLHDIRNEVLDQDLRAKISEETSNIRTLILANAFSNTSLIEG
jgi:His-Xaa-Ser system protein HxsD